MTFDGVCSGTDCLADKGVAYVAVRKGDRRYHVFGTHAQSIHGFDVARVRAAQFARMRDFVDAQAIPLDEPVILAGDFNVDAATPELDHMLALLRAVRPPTAGELRFTWDAAANGWVRGRGHWFDYVLYAADHAAPREAWNRVVPLREGDLDLSDHYAVWGRLVMPQR
jgi:endonuclease/exonuclease/phosphatase family metal-dependent hydrolase